jgi:hypothetical protein
MSPDERPIPGEDRFGLRETRISDHVHESGEQRDQRPIRPGGVGASDLLANSTELIPKDQDLDFLCASIRRRRTNPTAR